MDKFEVYMIVGVSAVTIVGVTALLTGHDGSVLTTVIGAISAMAAYLIGVKKGGS